jgi:GT2 family glycosyltransferase
MGGIDEGEAARGNYRLGPSNAGKAAVKAGDLAADLAERVAVRPRVPDILLSAPRGTLRPRVQGKFLFLGDEKHYVRGVTYGTFRPDASGNEFPDPETVERDFAQMAANGLNAVRVFTAPPRPLLDAAQRHGLHVMVGLSAERYVGFLIDKKGAPDIEELVRAQVHSCAGHPALLCYALGNEIPASMARWLGRERQERYLERLFWAVKAEDPEGLVTYTNYPSTEYLQLPFLDLVCFNVYLESQERLQAYLARLQNVAGDRPLIMGEIGLDSRSHGEEAQSRMLDWQIRTTFAAGCSGAFVFGWTDEWHTGGADVEDWEFGLTTRDRRPKPALAAVREAFGQVPFPADLDWPRVSVIVCSRNGARTLHDCFAGLSRLEYPDFEVIVVDDGSTDGTEAIVEEYGFRVIRTDGWGLGAARNIGLEAATGEIVAYLDDDAYPDPHWLTYLAVAFLTTPHAGMGGPNIPPAGNGAVADSVANAPGGPVHVLLSDAEAEHIPGCNLAFRKSSLEAIGGFDPRFHVAGDDVDVCWRLREEGSTLGFCPSAVVWHHRRNSIRAYWRQQRGYGKAEALLEQKWPDKYNASGHVHWSGRVYTNSSVARILAGAGRIYHGTWGNAPFQPLYQAAPHVVWSLPGLPDWYLLIGVLAALSALGVLWAPLLFLIPVLGLAVSASLVHAWLSAASASVGGKPRSRAGRFRLRALRAFLHLLQPMARLSGRVRGGLVRWRRRGQAGLAVPRRRTSGTWSERWLPLDQRLGHIESVLRGGGVAVRRGGAHDRWDLEVRTGPLGVARLIMGLEDHALSKQLVRLRWWPRCSAAGVWMAALFAAPSTWAALDGAWAASAFLAAVPLAIALRGFQDCAAAMGAIAHALTTGREASTAQEPAPTPRFEGTEIAARQTP